VQSAHVLHRELNQAGQSWTPQVALTPLATGRRCSTARTRAAAPSAAAGAMTPSTDDRSKSWLRSPTLAPRKK